MTITLDPSTRQRLEARAQREGRDPEEIAAALLAASLGAEAVPDRETQLLRTLSDGLPERFWERKEALDQKAQAGTLTEGEHLERRELLTQMERWQVERLSAVVELARLRGQTPRSVMHQMGIPVVGDADLCVPAEHPLAPVFGRRQGDPMLDRVAAGVRRYRQRVEAQARKSGASSS